MQNFASPKNALALASSCTQIGNGKKTEGSCRHGLLHRGFCGDHFLVLDLLCDCIPPSLLIHSCLAALNAECPHPAEIGSGPRCLSAAIQFSQNVSNKDLLFEIQKEAVDGNTALSTVLRKCLVLGTRIGQRDLKDWAQWELNGYPASIELPEYRILKGLQS
jgi:AbiTii-like protein